MIKIEVWSDINCPFCYIGKRHLERALKGTQVPVDVEWKSFELDPTARPPKGSDQTELLAQKYNKDRAWALQMNANITDMARESGLNFNMSELVPANSFNAHRLIHFAKTKGVQDKMKERLLKARFEEGKDIDDEETLVRLGAECGLEEPAVRNILHSESFSREVRNDEAEAARLGISGVPFFVFNRQYAFSGAQPVDVFQEILQKLEKEGQ